MNVKQLVKRILPQRTTFTAVDYGTRAIKVATVSLAGPQPTLLQLVRTAQPELGNDETDEGARLSRLAEAVDAAGIKGQHVFAALGADKVITRLVRVPRMPEKELASAVSFEAEKSIPIPLSDLIVRYVKLGETEGEDGTQQQLLLAAVPAQVVHDFYELFVQAGVTISALDLQPLALWRVLGGVVGHEEHPAEVVAVADLGAAHTTLIVVDRGALVFCHSLGVGGDLLTKSMADTYGIDFGEAQQLKEKSGKILSAEEAANITSPDEMQLDFSLRDGLGEIVRELRRALDYYAAGKNARPIKRLVLSGGTCNLKGFVSFMAEALEFPVELGTLPFAVPQGVEAEMSVCDPAMFMAVGLALREARFSLTRPGKGD
ncbi:MAG: type IV pilus assembly protein PilM [Bacillota bacterium]